jgi:chromate transporter
VSPDPAAADAKACSVPLGLIAREWTRIGVTGFGGPPAHIALFRSLVVGRGWIAADEFEEAIAACNLLPGPASTQLAMLCARRLAGPPGLIIGGVCFIAPAVALILVLSLLFLAHAPPDWVRGAGAGAGAAVAAVAVAAGIGLLVPSWRRAAAGARATGERAASGGRALARQALGGRQARWGAYVLLGGVAAAVIGPYLVLVLAGCGLCELALATGAAGGRLRALVPWPAAVVGSLSVGGLGAVAWVAFKVGALSYGGGFVIVPLMQHDAVHTYHWMSASRFLDAVALGQVTPGPVVATVAAVGYAAHGLLGGLLAAAVAFAPSFAFVLIGGGHFDRLRHSDRAQAFLFSAGAAAIGAILGSAIPLALALQESWQVAVLAAAAIALLVARRGVVVTLVGAGAIGTVVALAGGPVPH